MRVKSAFVVLLFAGLILFTEAQAQSTPIYNGPSGSVTRCPAGDSGCNIYNAPENIQERVKQGRRDVRDADNPLDKVNEVGKTLRDCMNCAMDAVKGVGKGEDSR